MERRQSKRIEIEQQAMLYCYGVLVAEGTTANLSAHGAYVRLKWDLSGGELQTGLLLEVVIVDPECDPLMGRSSVELVRKGKDGIALAFRNE